MKKKILAVALVVLFAGCNQTKQTETPIASLQVLTKENQPVSQGYELMKTYCYACHNPKAASHDVIIAPPFKAVKMKYSSAYRDRADFINAIVTWVQNPNQDKALMRGAVNKFKLMPQLPLPAKDLEKIAAYLYDNEPEEPIWMAEHMKEMQGSGMGSGMGKGMGSGMGKGMGSGMGKGKINKN